MIDAQTSKILKFIAKHQPCSFEKSKSALEEYQRASNAIIIAIISISISFLIFLKPPDFNIVDTFNRFTQWLFENLQFLLCSHTFF